MTLQFKAKAVKTPASTHLLFSTGKVPGMAQSNNETLLLIGEAYFVEAPENNLLTDLICACTSRPTTLFHVLKT